MKTQRSGRGAPTEEEARVHGAVVAALHPPAADGAVRVALPGREPCAARVLASVPRAELARAAPGREVLVLCEEGDPARPVVIGMMEDPAEAVLSLAADGEAAVAAGEPAHRVFSAEGSISLVCGAASLTLHADGRVVTRGVNVVSVASEQQRIQGAVVRIN